MHTAITRGRYEPVQVGADLVGLASTDSVALSATGLEKTSSLASITYKTEQYTLLAIFPARPCSI